MPNDTKTMKPCNNCGSIGGNIGCDTCGPPVREKQDAPDGCVYSRRYQCEECHDTGYFGDMGPGRAGNNEYVPCDCRRDKRTDDEKWHDQFVMPIATEMNRRGIGEMRIRMTGKGTAVFELIPENEIPDACIH